MNTNILNKNFKETVINMLTDLQKGINDLIEDFKKQKAEKAPIRAEVCSNWNKKYKMKNTNRLLQVEETNNEMEVREQRSN